MLFLYKAKLVLLSQPKTGTTALQRALANRASISLNNPPAFKHISYVDFMKLVAPMIKRISKMERDEYEVVSVIREPVDWLGSWYRYRKREGFGEKKDPEHARRFTGNLTFEEFVHDACAAREEGRPGRKIGSPLSVSIDGAESIGVDRLYPYDDMSQLIKLIEERSGKPVKLEIANASPVESLQLTEATRNLVRERMAFEFDVYQSLRPDGLVLDRFRKPKEDDENAARLRRQRRRNREKT